MGMLAFGVVVGLVIGILPGLGGIVGMSILLPFVPHLDEVAAFAMLIGMVAVIPTSDTFPSVLMGIPGSSGSQATILDGYPLAQRGEAARALGNGVILLAENPGMIGVCGNTLQPVQQGLLQ